MNRSVRRGLSHRPGARPGARVALGALALLAALVALLASPASAGAHALLQSSDPAAGATLATAPAAVTITFGEPADPRLSSIQVLDASGTNRAAGPVAAVEGAPTQLRVPLGPLPPGTYTVAWRAVSAIDGHVAAGSFAFGVGVAPSAAPAGGQAGAGSVASPGVSAPAALARWLLYVGLVALLGSTFLAFAIEPRPPRSLVRMAGAGWLAAALGTVGVVAAEWSETGADLGTLLVSSAAGGALERVAVTAGAGIVVAVLLTWPGPIERWLFGLGAASAAGGMLVDVLTGHAAAGALSSVDVLVQWLHAVGAGLWIGGLAALLLLVRGSPGADRAALARRFSRWALVMIALVAGTGLVRAIAEVRTLDDLVGTDFGRLVILKSALLGLLGLLGAANRFVTVPGAARSLRGLRRVGSTEVVLGTVVLAITAVLVNLAPPASVGTASAAPPAPASVVAAGSDFGTSVRLRLVVTPGTPGQNTFSAAVTDYDTGQPAPASAVSLRFELASRSGVGASTLALAAGPSGTFVGAASDLSIDGIWKVTATVTGASGSVEVPLALATAVAAQPVDEVVTPGAPTIDTVHLPGGDAVQLYLDPGRPGSNDLHATFFDPSGAELPVPSATFLVAPDAGPGVVLAGSQLEPGHFTVPVMLAAGELAVDVVGAAPGGAQLHAHLRMEVRP